MGIRTRQEPAILIVEGDVLALAMLCSALWGIRAEMHTAVGYQEALLLLEADAFDLAIVNMSLPDGDGLGLAGKIREVNPQARLIIVTGEPDTSNVQISLSLNVDAYLVKPLDMTNLVNVVRDLLVP